MNLSKTGVPHNGANFGIGTLAEEGMLGANDYFAAVALRSVGVELVPISREHVSELSVIGAEPQIWRWMPTAHYAPDTMSAFVESALILRDGRRAVPFTTIDRLSGRVAGSTRFHFIEPEQRRLEIGVTWVGLDFQRTHVNTEAKMLQMWYAFEVLGCRRVEWKTDAENHKSREAVLRLGAKEEGFFRKHMIYPDGRNRDSVYFALIDDEWPIVRKRLEARLGHAFEPSFTLLDGHAR